ncbi:MAG: hypothetical protein ABR521_07925 [Gaiellaceae bacterium]
MGLSPDALVRSVQTEHGQARAREVGVASDAWNGMLRILMVLHAPWTLELGLSRCSVELADEFRALGHRVDKFDLDDAFPRRTRLGSQLEGGLFWRRAVAFVQRHGHEYDVIQAEQGNLPVPRRALGYGGVLVCRSDGLVHFYVEWLR